MKVTVLALFLVAAANVQAGSPVSRHASPKKKPSVVKPGLQPDGNRIIGRAELNRSHTVADALRRYPEISIRR